MNNIAPSGGQRLLGGVILFDSIIILQEKRCAIEKEEKVENVSFRIFDRGLFWCRFNLG